MIYSDSKKTALIIAIIIVGIVAGAAYQLWGDRISEYFSSRDLLGQVTSVSQDDQTWLLNLQGLAFLTPEEVSSEEDLRARFIETLLTHATTDFNPDDAAEAEAFLKMYYDMPDPLPAERSAIQDIITQSVDTFIQTYPLITNAGQTLLNDLLTVLANHQASSNHFSAVRRAQSTRAFMDAIVKQL